MRWNYAGGNAALDITIVITATIALYNAIELLILIFLTFKHPRGLYFWSLLLSTALGVTLHTIGHLLDFTVIGPKVLAATLSTFGFFFLVPGQSMVLYSRLHLVLRNPRLLGFIRWFVIVASMTVFIPTTVLTYGSMFTTLHSFVRGYVIMERIQVTWYCAQEFVLSSLYIIEILKLLRLKHETETRKTVSQERRGVMYETVKINIVMMGMDVALVILEYLGLFPWQVALKSAVYSIKLKLEFAVLGKLIEAAKRKGQPELNADVVERGRTPSFVRRSRMTTSTSNVTHAAAPFQTISSPSEGSKRSTPTAQGDSQSTAHQGSSRRRHTAT